MQRRVKLPPATRSSKKEAQNKDLWNAIALQQNLLKEFRFDVGVKVPKPKIIRIDDEPVQQLTLGIHSPLCFLIEQRNNWDWKNFLQSFSPNQNGQM
jgi:hypothetical protein